MECKNGCRLNRVKERTIWQYDIRSWKLDGSSIESFHGSINTQSNSRRGTNFAPVPAFSNFPTGMCAATSMAFSWREALIRDSLLFRLVWASAHVAIHEGFSISTGS